MAKNKDIKRSFWRFAAGATAIAILFLFLRTDNVVRWVQAGFTLRKQEQTIKHLEQENARLEKEAETLRTDRDSLEKYARETFGFAEPGDDIYVEE